MNYVLRTAIRVSSEDCDRDKTPFTSSNDKQAVFDGIKAAMLYHTMTPLVEFTVDTMEIGPVDDSGMVDTTYSRRLFNSSGDPEMNLVEDEDLPSDVLDFLKTLR